MVRSPADDLIEIICQLRVFMARFMASESNFLARIGIYLGVWPTTRQEAEAIAHREAIMAIKLNHTIVPAHDKEASARFVAQIFGSAIRRPDEPLCSGSGQR
jgi:hypothetical protein